MGIDFNDYKNNLRRTYAASHRRLSDSKPEDKKTFQSLKAAIKFNGDITAVLSYIKNQPAFGQYKNSFRGYAIFTADTYYGVDGYEKPCTCKYSDIVKVSVVEEKKGLFKSLVGELFSSSEQGIITLKNRGMLSLDADIARVLMGFAVINGLKDEKDDSFRRFILSKEVKAFGEYINWSLEEGDRKRIEALYNPGYGTRDIAQSVAFRCSLKELEIDRAVFRIKIKDTDIRCEDGEGGLYTEDEWSDAIEYIADSIDIRQVFCESIKRTIALEYAPEDIEFETNIKVSLKTRAEIAALKVSGAMSYMERKGRELEKEREKMRARIENNKGDK